MAPSKKRKKKKRSNLSSKPPIDGMPAKDYNQCKNAVRSAIRKQFARSSMYDEFLESHRVEWKEKVISDNFKIHYRKRVSYPCNKCKELFSKKDIAVDHIKPIGSGVFNGIEDTYRFFKLVYCESDNLQILCKGCHKRKTALENKNKSFENASF